MKRRIIIRDESIRQRALEAVREAQIGQSVTIADQTRSLDQNALLHSLLTDIAKSNLTWAGKRRTVEEWKNLFVSGHAVATRHDAEIVPGMEGETVSLRESTATMSKARSTSLIEYIKAFMAQNGIEERG